MVAMTMLWAAVMGWLVACGDDGNGDNDTLLTGLSGVVILVLVLWGISRAVRKHRG